MKPFTFKFKFRTPASEKPTPPLVIDFETHQRAQETLRMMQEGKMPVPNNYAGLTKGELASLGITKVRYSKKFDSKYVGLTERKAKQYDS